MSYLCAKRTGLNRQCAICPWRNRALCRAAAETRPVVHSGGTVDPPPRGVAMHLPPRQQRPRRSRVAPTAVPGFTLIELMVSIALVLVLVLGVNAVFRMATETVGVGMAMS